MSHEKIFGTDGIRRKVSDFTVEFLIHLGQTIGYWLGQNNQTATVLIGRDTRRSGELIEAALTTGLLAQGVNVSSLGVIPTSGVAYLTKETEARLGIMLSGSHNSAADNGIKFFNEQGFKLTETTEQEIEALLGQHKPYPLVAYDRLGKIKPGQQYFTQYAEHLVTSWKGKKNLAGCKIVVDCTHGATYQLGPDVLKRLGAEVIVLNNQPDGLNINPDYTGSYDSHKPASVPELVVKSKANFGIGFDGDGDRLLLVDEQGNYLDGDHILAMLAQDMQARHCLTNNTVVTTIMRNLGLDLAFEQMGIGLAVTPVGDKYVADCMVQNNYVLGGEQAGHIIIFEDGQTTGDGIYVALRVAALLVNSGQPLSALAGMMQQYPQKIEHVRNVPPTESLAEITGLVEQIKKSEEVLTRSGPQFINVRYSGTERGLVRITVKGIVQAEIEQEAAKIAAVIETWQKSQGAG
ncbi:MAG: phosphoglucosamine mutase [Anaerolineae bacterium]|nr:phosphoglucosamine mutase [Anaerolineae bacterium]